MQSTMSVRFVQAIYQDISARFAKSDSKKRPFPVVLLGDMGESHAVVVETDICKHSCSVFCYKRHKNSHAVAGSSESRQSYTTSQSNSIDADNGTAGVESPITSESFEANTFQNLGSSSDLRDLLGKSPQLRVKLHQIFTTTVEAASELRPPSIGSSSYGHDAGRQTFTMSGPAPSGWSTERRLRQALNQVKSCREQGGLDMEVFVHLALKLSPVKDRHDRGLVERGNAA